MGRAQSLSVLAVLPENKQSKKGNEDTVREVRIAVRADPLQEKVGENGRVKPSDQQQKRDPCHWGKRDDRRPSSWRERGAT